MEMWLAAPAAATVRAVHVRVGEQVAAGALLVELELAGTRKPIMTATRRSSPAR